MTSKAALTHFTFGLLLTAGAATSSHALSAASGEIRGNVVDASGAMISRAQISISTPAGLLRKLKSGAKGSYQVPGLAPGFYSISVQAPGFTTTRQWVEVESYEVIREDITLPIALEQPTEDFEIEISVPGQ